MMDASKRGARTWCRDHLQLRRAVTPASVTLSSWPRFDNASPWASLPDGAKQSDPRLSQHRPKEDRIEGRSADEVEDRVGDPNSTARDTSDRGRPTDRDAGDGPARGRRTPSRPAR